MPELPEVETTLRGILPHLMGQTVLQVVVRQPKLRWPIPARINNELKGQRFTQLQRRGKYLLLRAAPSTVIVHLGMSGSLSVVPLNTAPGTHDHVDIVLSSGVMLRLNDPRRFGAVLLTQGDPLQHRLLRNLGPEPLGKDFTGSGLYRLLRKRSCSIKQAIMNSHVVVGVGNIYASEALFSAGIHPTRAANRISQKRCQLLVEAIVEVLCAAIKKGGTTLRDFVGGDGKPGYFQNQLLVYGRDKQLCTRCGGTVGLIRQGGRASYYCPGCQR